MLAHSVECAHLAAMMADELGASAKTARRAALLHDIGKAVSHEVEGPHALVGGELARRHGESEAVAHAMEAHHNEVEPQTIEAVLVQSADALSGARPGARGESLEQYVKRLRDLEQIATRHDGVDKVYAMQAGREIRVMVMPSALDDDGAVLLSHEIAREIEQELEYPGPDQGHRHPGVASNGLRALRTSAATRAGPRRTCRVGEAHHAPAERGQPRVARAVALERRAREVVAAVGLDDQPLAGQQKSTSTPSWMLFTSGRGMSWASHELEERVLELAAGEWEVVGAISREPLGAGVVVVDLDVRGGAVSAASTAFSSWRRGSASARSARVRPGVVTGIPACVIGSGVRSGRWTTIGLRRPKPACMGDGDVDPGRVGGTQAPERRGAPVAQDGAAGRRPAPRRGRRRCGSGRCGRRRRRRGGGGAAGRSRPPRDRAASNPSAASWLARDDAVLPRGELSQRAIAWGCLSSHSEP